MRTRERLSVILALAASPFKVTPSYSLRLQNKTRDLPFAILLDEHSNCKFEENIRRYKKNESIANIVLDPWAYDT